PELPGTRRDRFVREYQLTAYDAEVLTSSAAVSEYFEAAAKASSDGKSAANWVMTEVLGALKANNGSIADFSIRPDRLGALLKLVSGGTVSHTAAKQIFGAMLTSSDAPDAIAK